MRRSVLVAFLAASLPPLPAQNGTTVPASLANAFGNFNNSVPMATVPTQYQQIFDGSELPTAYLMTGLGLRQDENFANRPGALVDLEINLGVTSLTVATLGTTFAANFNLTPPTNVLARQRILLPDMTPTPPTNPQEFLVIIPFTTPFSWNATPSENLLIQITNRGNSNGNSAFSYPLDAGTGINTSRLTATPATATTGTVTMNFGHVMRFFSGSLASVGASGTGCVAGALSFYEYFTGNNTFDLSNQSIQLVPTGGGYTVQPSNAQFVPPTGSHLNLTDDVVTQALPMPFTLAYPGGSTNRIVICSNGYIYLNATGSAADVSASVVGALTGGPRLFMLWMDLLPDPTNNVYYNVDAANNLVRVTFNNVPEYGQPTTSNTFQYVIHASGIIDLVWLNCANTAHNVLMGFSPGVNNRDPGNRDMTTALPFTTQADLYPLSQNATRPIMGRNVDLQVNRIPAGSFAGIELIGRSIPGIDLTPIGMPTCSLYISPIILTLTFGTGGTSATIPVPVPNNPSVDGVQLPVQALVLSPSSNPFGAITSNLCTLTIGQG